MRHEYEIYRRLEGTAVPAARALWFEDDTSLAPDDRGAYVRTMVEGHWRLPFLSSTDPADDDEKIAASKEHLRRLATVHSVDWQSQGFDDLFPVPDGPGDVAHNLIAWFSGRLAEFRCEPSPVLAEGLDWLRATARSAPAVTLCKGTNGHGEEIWRDGRIVAMSDWEPACIAEPAYDLAQCQEMIPTIERDGRLIWGWDDALAYYREQSGIDVSMENVRWYRLFYALPMLLFTHNAASLVHKGGNRHVRFAWTATENLYRAELAFASLGGFAPKRVPEMGNRTR
jgi:aminoglycoside phosphotransferase (APT) family kinase protein